ncbi:MAG: hypothetical protein H0X23_10500 [Rubrobacter sp.]|nr:hypothetical protein [Rubrobacter sp.]
MRKEKHRGMEGGVALDVALVVGSGAALGHPRLLHDGSLVVSRAQVAQRECMWIRL